LAAQAAVQHVRHAASIHAACLYALHAPLLLLAHIPLIVSLAAATVAAQHAHPCLAAPLQVPEQVFAEAMQLAQAAVAQLIPAQLKLAQRRSPQPAQLQVASVPAAAKAALQQLAAPLAAQVLAEGRTAKADRGGALQAAKVHFCQMAAEQGLVEEHQVEVSRAAAAAAAAAVALYLRGGAVACLCFDNVSPCTLVQYHASQCACGGLGLCMRIATATHSDCAHNTHVVIEPHRRTHVLAPRAAALAA
jgi:hypothetical protein